MVKTGEDLLWSGEIWNHQGGDMDSRTHFDTTGGDQPVKHADSHSMWPKPGNWQ